MRLEVSREWLVHAFNDGSQDDGGTGRGDSSPADEIIEHNRRIRENGRVMEQ